MSHRELNSETAVSPYNPELRDSVSIYDTTLRDGEQTPGVALSSETKAEIAHELDSAGVPEIELGFPEISTKEKQTVEEITASGLNADTLALARAKEKDVFAAVDSGVDRITIVVPISDRHIDTKTKWSTDSLIKQIRTLVTEATSTGVDVSVSAEDATRTPLHRLQAVLTAAEEAGASRVHLPDTVGAATPLAIRRIVSKMRSALDSETEIGVHCHDDCGMAVSNTLAGFEAGADIGAVTVNGIGERAGNAALEEVVVALEALYDVNTSIETTALTQLSEIVARRTGISIAETKPVVGKHCFMHESGIHVDAIIDNPATYEALSPGLVGKTRKITIGKHSGSTAFSLLSNNQSLRSGRSIPENTEIELGE